jgi:hypothetical protein
MRVIPTGAGQSILDRRRHPGKGDAGSRSTLTGIIAQALNFASTRRQAMLVLLPLALYAAALNPFFLPATYDNIVYYFGGISLAEEGSYRFQGMHVVDWPPGVSALLAVPFSLGWKSVWAAKICILLVAAGGLLLGLRLLQNEKRPFPVLTLSLFALLPFSFLVGTRTMGEWPYFLASVAFLLALRKLRHNTGNLLLPAVGAGLLLGAASLTKFTGVLLGAAVVAQITQKWLSSARRPAWGAILPEVITAVTGAGIFLIWKVKLQLQITAGTASTYDYYHSGWVPEHLGPFVPFRVPERISDLLFHCEAGVSLLGWSGWPVVLACAVPGLVVLAGMIIRLRSRERTPSDWYVLVVLLMFSVIGTNQQTRYLMPVAPFLIGYGFLACRELWRSFGLDTTWSAKWLVRPAIGCWILALIGAAGHLVFSGSLSGTHRGLNYQVSKTPETFYRGSWLDLYLACKHVRNDPTHGRVAVIGEEDKYVTAFTGREVMHYSPGEDFTFLLVLDKSKWKPGEMELLNLVETGEFDSVALFKKKERNAGDPGAPGMDGRDSFESFPLAGHEITPETFNAFHENTEP